MNLPNIPIGNTVAASILITLALAIGIGILGNIKRKATKAVIGTVKLYEDKNAIFLSFVVFLVCIGAYLLFPNPTLLWIGSLPFIIVIIIAIIKRKRKKHASQI